MRRGVTPYDLATRGAYLICVAGWLWIAALLLCPCL